MAEGMSSRELRATERKKGNLGASLGFIVVVIVCGVAAFFVAKMINSSGNEEGVAGNTKVDLSAIGYDFRSKDKNNRDYRLPNTAYGDLVSADCAADTKDSRSCELGVSKSGFEAYGKEGRDAEIINFQIAGRVRQMAIMGFGNRIGNEILVLVMGDGQIRYQRIADIIENGNVEFSIVEGISDVIMVNQIVVIDENAVRGNTTVAETIDGSFYDLKDYIYKDGLPL